tara:strand:+ start:2082 stop:2978 length:897 start_codon:yes stop_codon:yes gene_type:complete
MKIIEWRNIPSSHFPINYKYFFRWVKAPIKPYILTQICKINNNKIFILIFKILNFFIFRWKIDVNFLKDEKMFLIKDNKNQIFVKRKTYINLYANGIQERLDKLENQYLLREINLKEKDIAIDVGACVGEVSMILSQKYKCKIFSFEPEESEFNCMLKNVNKENMFSYNLPLWNEEKEIDFYAANDLHDSSCFETEDYTHIIKKKTTTINKMFSKLVDEDKFIKLLKLEAEGAEPEILYGAEKVLPKIEYIIVDVGAERGLKYDTTLVEVVNFLQKNNFELIKLGTPRLMCVFKNKLI